MRCIEVLNLNILWSLELGAWSLELPIRVHPWLSCFFPEY